MATADVLRFKRQSKESLNSKVKTLSEMKAHKAKIEQASGASCNGLSQHNISSERRRKSNKNRESLNLIFHWAKRIAQAEKKKYKIHYTQSWHPNGHKSNRKAREGERNRKLLMEITLKALKHHLLNISSFPLTSIFLWWLNCWQETLLSVCIARASSISVWYG